VNLEARVIQAMTGIGGHGREIDGMDKSVFLFMLSRMHVQGFSGIERQKTDAIPVIS
jgi:hypothetical protein